MIRSPNSPCLMCLFVPLVLQSTVAAAPPRVADVPELEGLSERWQDAIESLGVPGMAVAIVKDGEVLALDSFGVRNPDGDPVTTDSMFYIASATKPYVAMTALILHQEGLLDIDDPVKKYLPRFQLANSAATESITVRDLMCHRSGINHGMIVWQDAYTGDITEDAYYRFLAEVDPPMQQSYTNVHFTLVGRVIEAVTGKPWKDVLRDRLLKPAGMDRTTAYASIMYGDEDAAIPMMEFDGEFVASPLQKTDRTMHAAGGMGTSAADAARWLVLNINGGNIGDTRILEDDLANEMLAMQQAFPEPRGSIRVEEGYGLGWEKCSYRGTHGPMYMHGGGYVGAASLISFMPEHGIGVAILCNTSAGAQLMTAIVQIDVFDRLLGIKDQSDLLPGYKQMAAQRRSQMTAPAGDNPAQKAGGLSLAAAEYVGSYHHDGRGTAEVVLVDGRLTCTLGDLTIRLFAGDEADELTYWIYPGAEGQAKFIIDGGAVAAMEIETGPGEMSRFERR